jgi:tRNA(Ile)-lysidine synthase TilS/MesJ
MNRELIVVTTHGTSSFDIGEDERVLDALARNHVPWTAVATYLRDPSGAYTLFPCLSGTGSSIPPDRQVFAFFQRNIDPFLHTNNTLQVSPPANNEEAVAEYIYANGAAKGGPNILKRLSSNECKLAVRDAVAQTLRDTLSPGDKLVVGVSGGGDSNALLYALSQFDEFPIDIHPVIIEGPGEWNSGVPRARELAQAYNLPLTVVSEEESKAILGASTGGLGITDRFAREFPDDDFEFLGTLIIRRVLTSVAKSLDAKFIATGLNFEDLLGEMFAIMATERRLLPLPARPIGDVTLVYPLWMTPKKIIDGCFPKYSFSNYADRYPGYAEGRNAYYSMAYWMASAFPGLPEKMLRWAAKEGSAGETVFPVDEVLGYETLEPVNWALRERFLRMLRTTA